MGGVDGMRAVASNNNSNDAGVDNDAATCAEMTTATVAPRRRVGHRSKKKDMPVDRASSHEGRSGLHLRLSLDRPIDWED